MREKVSTMPVATEPERQVAPALFLRQRLAQHSRDVLGLLPRSSVNAIWDARDGSLGQSARVALVETAKYLGESLPGALGFAALAALGPAYKERLALRKATLAPYRQNRCIFVHIPKCAGVAVADSLFGRDCGGYLKMRYYRLLFSPQEYQDYFKFTFVRNPWDRLVSAFHFLRDGGITERDRTWNEANLAGYEDFDHFVRKGLPRRAVRSWIHFIPQIDYLRTPWTSKLPVDFVGRFEHLERDFKIVCQRLGRTADLVVANQGKPRKADYRGYYSSTTQRIVEQYYIDDIRTFGYDF